jgi:hypothetical protein
LKIGRRHLALMLAGVAPLMAKEQQSLGDAGWLPKFRKFLKQLNLFLLALNDDVLDVKLWKKVEEAWTDLERS